MDSNDWDDPTIYFEIPDRVDLGLAVYEATKRAEEDTAWVFHANNPNVFLELRRLARELKNAGHSHYSIKGLFEVLRWHTALSTTDPKYKLNNNLTPFYARLLMQTDPELQGFFRLRTQRGNK